MRIAILSDSHDNIWKLDIALPILRSAEIVLHCGDIISPFMIRRLISGLGAMPIHIVWGNNDGDKRLLSQIALRENNVQIHGDFGLLDFNGFKVAIVHYPELARSLAESKLYDMVCYGHDHIAYESLVGNTLLINPGELMGLNGRSTIAIYDTKSKSVEIVDIV